MKISTRFLCLGFIALASASAISCLRLKKIDKFACESNSDCESDERCLSDRGETSGFTYCQEWPCDADSDCDDGLKCIRDLESDHKAKHCVDSDLCLSNSDCNDGAACTDGICSGLACDVGDDICGDYACNGQLHSCRTSCGSDGDCNSPAECVDDVCIDLSCDASDSSACGLYACDPVRQRCLDNCELDEECSGDASCEEGKCEPPACTDDDDSACGFFTCNSVNECYTYCSTDEECSEGGGCRDGTCIDAAGSCSAEETACDGYDDDCNGTIDDHPTNWLTEETLQTLDECAGVAWQSNTVPSGTAEEAPGACAALDHAGHTDWRLPTEEEIENLMADCRAEGRTCASCSESPRCQEVFGNSTTTYWLSDTSGPYRRLLHLHDGVRTQADAWGAVARCVRDL